MTPPRPTLEWLDHDLAVCRLDPSAPMPRWAEHAPFCCIMRTDTELSLVVPVDALPLEGTAARAVLRVEHAWRAVRIAGILPLTLTGVIAGLTRPLADAGVPVFVLSTFDTDYVLVHADRAEDATQALLAAGYAFSQRDPAG
jgi:hypothetical protein